MALDYALLASVQRMWARLAALGVPPTSHYGLARPFEEVPVPTEPEIAAARARGPAIVGSRVVSEPGAALRVTEYELAPWAREALDVGRARL